MPNYVLYEATSYKYPMAGIIRRGLCALNTITRQMDFRRRALLGLKRACKSLLF